MSTIMDLVFKARTADLNRVQQILSRTGKDFKVQLSEALSKAQDFGFSDASLTRYGGKLLDIAKKQAEILNQGTGKAEAKKMAALNQRFKREMENAEKIGEEIGRRAGLTLSESIEESASGLADGLQDLFSKDITRLGGVIKKLGNFAQIKGAGGPSGGAMGGLASFLGKIGPAIAAIGAAVAGIAALAKVVIDADAHLKELNKDLFTGGVAAGELADEYGSLRTNLKLTQETFAASVDALSFNRLWGTTAKDHMAILGAYAQAGFTFKKLTQGAQDAAVAQERLQKATETSLIYARLLGQESGAMAENMSNWMEGLGYNLNSIAESLSNVHMQAMQSGFGVKRFYTLLSQATADMSMYNVRLEEAGMLLTKLGKALGVKAAGTEIQGLTKGFADEGLQQRMKRVLTTPEMQALYERDAKLSAAQFIRNLAGSAEGKALQAVLEKALGGALTSEGLAKGLGSMNQKQQAELLAKAQLAGNDELVRSLETLMKASSGASGDPRMMAVKMAGLGMGAKLVARLQQAQNIQGMDTPLYEMGFEQLMAFENIAGISGEQLEQLILISKRTEGNFNFLKHLASKGVALSEEDSKKYARQFGASVQGGKVVSAFVDSNGQVQYGGELKSAMDMLMADSEAMQKVAEAGISQDRRLALEMSSNVTEITKILEQGVEYLLSKIAMWTENIWNWLSGPGTSDDEKRAQQKLLDEQRREDQKIADAMKALRNEIQNLSVVANRDLSSKESIDAQTQLAAKLKKLEEMDKSRQLRSAVQEELRSINGGRILDKSLSEISDEALQKVFGSSSGSSIDFGKSRDFFDRFYSEGDPAQARERARREGGEAGEYQLIHNYLRQLFNSAQSTKPFSQPFTGRVGASSAPTYVGRIDPKDAASLRVPLTGPQASNRTGNVTNIIHVYHDAPTIFKALGLGVDAGMLS